MRRTQDKSIKANVIAAPAHRILSKNIGSEVEWSYQLCSRISALPGINLTAICGVSDDTVKFSNVQVMKTLQSRNGGFFESLQFHFKVYRAWRSMLGQKNINIVHHMLPFRIDTTFSFIALSRLKGAKLIIGPVQIPQQINETSRGFSRLVSLLAKSGLKRLNLQLLNKADHIIAHNDLAKSMLIERGLSAAKISVVPTGVNSQPAARQKHLPTSPVLVTASGLTKRKNIKDILYALAHAQKRIPSISLVIIGDGPNRPILDRLVLELGLEDAVTFAGSMPNHEVQSYLKKSTLYVSTSLSESWGQSVLEAFSWGVPVVSYANSGASLIAAQSGGGLTTEISDGPQALADNLIRVCADQKLYSKLSTNALASVASIYSWDEAIVPEYLKVYKAAMEGASA